MRLGIETRYHATSGRTSARCDNCDRITWLHYSPHLEVHERAKEAAAEHARTHCERALERLGIRETYQLGEPCSTRSGYVFPVSFATVEEGHRHA